MSASTHSMLLYPYSRLGWIEHPLKVLELFSTSVEIYKADIHTEDHTWITAQF